MDGLILVHKPAGPTSHDIVARLRRILGMRKIGHGGTLDPFAAGLLVVAVGQATRLFPYFALSEKIYEGRLRLGTATDTYDLTGIPLVSPGGPLPDRAALQTAMARFQGDLIQFAPPFSAKKLDGKPFYAYARSGVAVEPRACPVRINRFVLRAFNSPDVEFEISCSTGTYIRALAHDLGVNLGCGAHLVQLLRTGSGAFRLEDARTLEKIEADLSEGRPDRFLLPMENLLLELPLVRLTEIGRKFVGNGRPIDLSDPIVVSEADPIPSPEAIFRLFDPSDRLIGLARRRETSGIPFLVLI
jgi:tRNA pseudouridine55 synthase